MGQTETSPLLPDNGGEEPTNGHSVEVEPAMEAAASSATLFSSTMLVIQVTLVAFYLLGTTYTEEKYEVKEYIAFRDIMAMLLLGFGFLMTFLRDYGLSAVGLTMGLSVYAMLVNIPVELGLRFLYGDDSEDTTLPLPLSMPVLIDAEFAAATLMITFGALIGRASPMQMMVIMLSEAVFYAANKVFLVLGWLGAEDVGGSMTIHMFGAVFGLAASYALGPPSDPGAAEAGEADKVSDVFAFVGTTILWVFWPSFVGATETRVPANEMRCVINTIVALLASTTAAFYVSHKLTHGRLDPVHIANSTLAGGVAIGSGGRLDIGPGAAMVLSLVVGAASVYGYVYSTPYLQSKFSIHDTCGVGNLHGIPSLIGALSSMAFVAMDPTAEFLEYGLVSQVIRQLLGTVATIIVAGLSGYGTGLLAVGLKDVSTPSYLDSVWWHAEYFHSKQL